MINDSVQIARARNLRRNMTFAESRVWTALKGGKLGGFKFRRQHPIGAYIADFCCVQAKVIVELDGDAHLGREYQDDLRTRYFHDCGFVVIRFENCDTKYEETKVLEVILKACLRAKKDGEVVADIAPHP